MTKLVLCLTALLMACGLLYCTREDGLPDPPFQQLVPCHPDGGGDDPLACPQPSDDSGALDPTADAGFDG